MIHHQILLHLHLIAGVGPATIAALYNALGVEHIADVYAYTVSDFMKLGFSYDRASKIVNGLADHTLLEKELYLLQKHAIEWRTLASDNYPVLLKSIEQPPAVLYYQGAAIVGEHDKMLAFVGSRKADAYARVVIDRLIPQLVAHDWTIVSGGALGVDTFVHDATVKAGGKTIVVLGSGLLSWYPSSNRQLFTKIVQSGGTIVSAFPLQTQPLAGNFPARNRIIAGLSQGTVVVQAAQKSGALITADFALEQGRQVFAVPGSIEHGLHDGCHALIQQGAKLVTSPYDIMIEFDTRFMSSHEVSHQLPLYVQQEHIDAVDRILLDKLLVPCSIEELLVSSQMSLEDLMQKLFDLSLQGKIKQDIMGLWARI